MSPRSVTNPLSGGQNPKTFENQWKLPCLKRGSTFQPVVWSDFSLEPSSLLKYSRSAGLFFDFSLRKMLFCGNQEKCALQPVELLWHLFAAWGQPFIHKHLEFGADVQWRALGRLVAGCLYRFRSEIWRRVSVCCLWSCALPNANNNTEMPLLSRLHTFACLLNLNKCGSDPKWGTLRERCHSMPYSS